MTLIIVHLPVMRVMTLTLTLMSVYVANFHFDFSKA